MSSPDRDALAALRDASNMEEMRAALNRAQRRLAKKVRDTDQLVEAVYQGARDGALSVGPMPPPPKVDRRKRGAEVALMHLTDWQYGKRTETFNREVCEQRVRHVVESSLNITDLHRSAMPVKECHIMYGGDMVEGIDIFPGQAWEVDGSLYEQMMGAARLMAWSTAAALAHFDVVHVWPEFGNHGRIGRKGEMPAMDNVDRMAYAFTRQMCAEAEASGRLVWHPETTWYQLVVVGEYRALLVHGDEIRSFGGNHPSYGIVKKCNAWASGVIEPFHDVYMGHFHRPDTYTLSNGGTIYITGTVESGNEYAREFIAATGTPQQRLHFVHPGKGRITAEYRIDARTES